MQFRHLSLTAVMATTILGVVVATNATSAIMTCENLAGVVLKNAKVTSAEVITAGAFVAPSGNGRNGNNPYANLPSFCRVAATLTPSSDSDIKMELWLPMSGWNGKFEVVGNAGWGGTIPYSSIAGSLASGYAGAGTDTGHTGNNADFAFGHPEKMIDLGYRSIHELTVQSKVLIKTHYGAPAKFSYFNGCSQGGRQGLAEAQRYPEDFNGIIAGASSWNQMRMHAARTVLNIAVNKNADAVIPRTKYAMIHNAVLKSCDELDGVRDGVIENPEECSFDYAALICKGGDYPDCLTKGQVRAAKAMTSPVKDPKTGKVVFEGHLMPGSELGWATIGGTQPLGLSISGLRNVVFKDKSWDYHTIDASTDIEIAATSDGGATYTGDPNLKPFFDRGGKLFMYHGWSDSQVNPMNSVAYYDNVVKTVGKSKAANSIALFMIPGMDHCSGGAGTDSFDKVAVLEKWVEQKETPKRIVASHRTGGKVDKTRPICPYGQVAVYSGTGDTNDAVNFACKPESVSLVLSK